MFKENFIKLCNKNNVSPSFVCQKIGLSNSTFTQWTDTSIPRQATLMKIADYFGITVDYLLGKEKSPSNDEELENVISYHRDGKTVRTKLTKKQLDVIHNLIQTIKESDEDL